MIEARQIMENDQFLIFSFISFSISTLITIFITQFTPILTYVLPGAEIAFVILLFVICLLATILIIACSVK